MSKVRIPIKLIFYIKYNIGFTRNQQLSHAHIHVDQTDFTPLYRKSTVLTYKDAYSDKICSSKTIKG